VQADLVRRAQHGDEHAFAQLVPDAATRLLAVAFRILHDQALAEDATQQALLSAWTHLGELRDAERFDAWTYRLVVRACYRESRRRRLLRNPLTLLADRQPAGRDETVDVINRDRIERGFRRLSLEHRSVLVLHHHVGLPLTEVAVALGVPVGTARSRLHYASRALRASIEADEARTAKKGLT
jgi:RNA polymerase sigma-70 factor (ECF subfamily)